MSKQENNPQEEKVTLLFKNLQLVAQHYELMKEMYNEQKNDLETALNEIARLKKELRSKPVAKFQFNVN